MSQKNGHALESVTLTAMLRRWTSSLLLIAVAAAGALSAMILQFRAHFGDLKSYVFKDMATEIRKMVVTLRCIAKT